MNLRLTLSISMVLNLALLAGIVSSRKNPAAPEKQLAAPAAAATNRECRVLQTISPTTETTFRWSTILSPDLKAYRDNLLAIGCPRPTVRDIILGEINELFGPRRQALLAGVQNRFWECVLRGGEQAVREEAVGPFLQLKAERETLINDLLGDGFGVRRIGEDTEQNYFQYRFSWLPDEKRDQLHAAEEKRSQLFRDLVKTAGDLSDRQLTAEESQRLQAIRKEYEDTRNKLLTPEEEEESRLRQSNESLWAADMSGFEATPDEWKSVTRLRMENEKAKQNLIYTDLTDEERRKESEKLDATLTEALKNSLGVERYTEYARARDDQFQGIYKVTQRYGLAESVATQAYDVQQSAAAKAEQLRHDTTLTPETRQEALLGLQRETEQALAKALGDKVLFTYKEYSGDWLNELSH